MTTRERGQDEPTIRPTTAREADGPPESRTRSAGHAFLQAADAAIERALSVAPEEFLHQNMQLGGQ
jgi:hypothetical protein